MLVSLLNISRVQFLDDHCNDGLEALYTSQNLWLQTRDDLIVHLLYLSDMPHFN